MSTHGKSFRIKIAGRVFKIHPLSHRWRVRATNFMTDEPEDYIVPVNRKAEDKYREWMEVYYRIARFLLKDDVILFHGSCIAVDGTAFLFTGPKGIGKSTQSRLWKEHFGDRAVMVNDDKPLLKVTDDGVTAYGTPWEGKEKLGSNISVPLKDIVVLGRSETNTVSSLCVDEAFLLLYDEVYRPFEDADAMEKVLDLLNDLLTRADLFRLDSNAQTETVQTVYEELMI